MVHKQRVLCVVGDLVEDIVVHSTVTTVRDTDNRSRIERQRGGSAANVAVAAAVAGAAVRFIGRVGHDAVGQRLERELVAAGVDARVQRCDRTGAIVVVVEPGGARTMFPDRAAAAELGAIDASWASGVTWLHVPAYSLCAEPIGTSTQAFVRRVRAGGAGLSIDVSSVAIVEEFGTAAFAALVRALDPDVVFATAEEADAVLGAGRAVAMLGALMVVKDGPRPVTLRHAEGRVEQVAVAAVDGVVDTTGAGDAFAAGFLVATLDGAGPVAAVAAGAALAARTLLLPGAALAPRGP